MNYWIEKTYPSQRDKGTFTKFLASPTESSDGKDIYRHMREVQVDDIVYHLDQDTNELVGYSEVADSYCVININNQAEYNVNLHNFHTFDQPINIDNFLSDSKNRKLLDKLKLVEKLEVFYMLKKNNRYYIKQGGYLTPLDTRLVKLFNPNILYDVAHPGIEEDEESFREGKIKYRLHRTKERNRKLIQKVKDNFKRKNNGKLYCQCCSFNFTDKYGAIGDNFIEAHHLVPVSQIDEDHETTPDKIVLLCSNCHRMIHRYRPWIDNLKDLPSLRL